MFLTSLGVEAGITSLLSSYRQGFILLMFIFFSMLLKMFVRERHPGSPLGVHLRADLGYWCTSAGFDSGIDCRFSSLAIGFFGLNVSVFRDFSSAVIGTAVPLLL